MSEPGPIHLVEDGEAQTTFCGRKRVDMFPRLAGRQDARTRQDCKACLRTLGREARFARIAAYWSQGEVAARAAKKGKRV